MMPGEEPLASSGHFEYHDRQRHDSFWGGLYATALAVTVFGGLYGSVHRCLYSLCCISLLPILLSTPVVKMSRSLTCIETCLETCLEYMSHTAARTACQNSISCVGCRAETASLHYCQAQKCAVIPAAVQWGTTCSQHSFRNSLAISAFLSS